MNGHPNPSHRGGVQQQHPANSASANFFAEHHLLISRLVRAATRKFPRADPSDLEQVARLALWNSWKTFKAARGRPFPNYASVCIKHALTEAGLKDLKQKPQCIDSLDEMTEQAMSESSGRHSAQLKTLARATETPDDAHAHSLLVEIAEVIGRLPPQLQTVYFEHVIGGRTQADLARKMRVSQQLVAQMKSEIQALLLDVLRDPEFGPPSKTIAALGNRPKSN